MLKLENLKKSFGGVAATRDVTLDFEPGSFSAIIGPNGAGKTTLFNLITGHLRPDSGRILLESQDIAGRHPIDIVRRGVGRAFQVASLFPTLTVSQAVAAAIMSRDGRLTSMRGGFPDDAAHRQALAVLELLGMERAAGTLTRNLSHGDQKLLDIGLALALEPRVLLLDEPTAGMGPEERWRMIETVQRLWRERRMTLIFIEHDMDIVFRVAQTVRVLCYGAVLAEGTPEQVKEDPRVIEAYLGHQEGEGAA